MKRLLALVLTISLALALVGCPNPSKFLPVIQDVIVLVQDTIAWLDTVDAKAQQVLTGDQLKQYQEQSLQCRQALLVATQLTKVKSDVSQQDADAAFNEFRTRYQELVLLLQSFGVMSADGQFKATAGAVALDLPPPLVIVRHVQQ